MGSGRMEKKHILFLHGFASSARPTTTPCFRQNLQGLPQIKYHAIDLNPAPHDFEYVTTTGLVDRLRQFVLGHSLLTSSLNGGVERMLLLTPALCWLSGGLSGWLLGSGLGIGAVVYSGH